MLNVTEIIGNIAGFFFFFFFSIVYIVERNVCPSGPLFRVGRIKVWWKVGGINVSNIFFPLLCLVVEMGRGLHLAVKLYQNPEMGGSHLMLL